MKLDILVLAAHPDDAELTCGGTILAHVAQGKTVGIVDLTQGELGTRGTVEIRRQEAEVASDILGLRVRENLRLPDGFFQNNREHQLAVVGAIRRFRPEIVLASAVADRHPDHGRAASLITDACFLAGLRRVETPGEDGTFQSPWRPRCVYHFIQDRYLTPDLVVDVSIHWEKKLAAIRAYKSQFYDPESAEPLTYIASEGFMDAISARGMEMGHHIGVKYGEGFTKEKHLGVKSLFDLI